MGRNSDPSAFDKHRVQNDKIIIMKLTKKQFSSIVILSIVIVVMISIQAFQFWSWNDEVSIWVFDVGQGDSIFVDANVQVLIDGGPTDTVIEKLSIVMPFWDRSIDLIVNTHPHADHLTGLISVLRRYQIGEVWVSGQEYETSFSDAFNDSIDALSVMMTAGHSIELDQNVVIKVVWPITNLEGIHLDDPNDGSIVLLIECFETRILLTGDIGIEEELLIMDQIGDIDVLKVAHQGSATSSHIEFLEVTRPEVAIISVGENDYGHPHESVLNRFDQIGTQVYRTDLHGDVRIVCSEYGYEIKLY